MHDDCPKEFQSNSLDSTKKVDFFKKERSSNVIAMESVNPLSSWRNYNDVSIRRGLATNFDVRYSFVCELFTFEFFSILLSALFKKFLENYFLSSGYKIM